MCWEKVESSFDMNSRQLCSFDIFSLLLGYYSLGFGTLLALKLIIRIIGGGGTVGMTLEPGGSWKNVEKLMVWSMYLVIWK